MSSRRLLYSCTKKASIVMSQGDTYTHTQETTRYNWNKIYCIYDTNKIYSLLIILSSIWYIFSSHIYSSYTHTHFFCYITAYSRVVCRVWTVKNFSQYNETSQCQKLLWLLFYNSFNIIVGVKIYYTISMQGQWMWKWMKLN